MPQGNSRHLNVEDGGSVSGREETLLSYTVHAKHSDFYGSAASDERFLETLALTLQVPGGYSVEGLVQAGIHTVHQGERQVFPPPQRKITGLN